MLSRGFKQHDRAMVGDNIRGIEVGINNFKMKSRHLQRRDRLFVKGGDLERARCVELWVSTPMPRVR